MPYDPHVNKKKNQKRKKRNVRQVINRRQILIRAIAVWFQLCVNNKRLKQTLIIWNFTYIYENVANCFYCLSLSLSVEAIALFYSLLYLQRSNIPSHNTSRCRAIRYPKYIWDSPNPFTITTFHQSRIALSSQLQEDASLERHRRGERIKNNVCEIVLPNSNLDMKQTILPCVPVCPDTIHITYDDVWYSLAQPGVYTSTCAQVHC